MAERRLVPRRVRGGTTVEGVTRAAALGLVLGVVGLFAFRAYAEMNAFAGAFEVSHTEIARVTDPTGALDAVVIESNGGATTPFGYGVYLVPHARPVDARDGSAVASFVSAWRPDSARGVRPRWAGPDDLRVEYIEARSAMLDRRAVSLGGRTVQVRLAGDVVYVDRPPATGATGAPATPR